MPRSSARSLRFRFGLTGEQTPRPGSAGGWSGKRPAARGGFRDAAPKNRPAHRRSPPDRETRNAWPLSADPAVENKRDERWGRKRRRRIPVSSLHDPATGRSLCSPPSPRCRRGAGAQPASAASGRRRRVTLPRRSPSRPGQVHPRRAATSILPRRAPVDVAMYQAERNRKPSPAGAAHGDGGWLPSSATDRTASARRVVRS